MVLFVSSTCHCSGSWCSHERDVLILFLWMEPWQMNLSWQCQRKERSRHPYRLRMIYIAVMAVAHLSLLRTKKPPHWHTWIFRAPPSRINPISLKCLQFQSFSSSGDGRWSVWEVTQQGQRPHSLRPSSLVLFFFFFNGRNVFYV